MDTKANKIVNLQVNIHRDIMYTHTITYNIEIKNLDVNISKYRST